MEAEPIAQDPAPVEETEQTKPSMDTQNPPSAEEAAARLLTKIQDPALMHALTMLINGNVPNGLITPPNTSPPPPPMPDAWLNQNIPTPEMAQATSEPVDSQMVEAPIPGQEPAHIDPPVRKRIEPPTPIRERRSSIGGGSRRGSIDGGRRTSVRDSRYSRDHRDSRDRDPPPPSSHRIEQALAVEQGKLKVIDEDHETCLAQIEELDRKLLSKKSILTNIRKERDAILARVRNLKSDLAKSRMYEDYSRKRPRTSSPSDTHYARICYSFNRSGCERDCGDLHLCLVCGGKHTMANCLAERSVCVKWNSQDCSPTCRRERMTFISSNLYRSMSSLQFKKPQTH
jgi:hypothetical protein